jgi:uncharacterized SAM-binding protein YcdF (DUF218 family)
LLFALSKILGFLTFPSNLMILAGVCGVVLTATRFARLGRWMAGLSLVALLVCGLSPLGRVLLLPLEQRFPPWSPTAEAPVGIVVLGGAVNGRLSQGRGIPIVDVAAERITAAVELARRYPQARIIYSGGSGHLVLQSAMEAPVARRLFGEMGVAPERIEIEDESRNTAENAALSLQIAKPKPGERWLLLTSAAHMPRSVGIFRRVGFAVEPHPVGWRTSGWGDIEIPFYIASDGLSIVDMAVREWIGLTVYRLTGRTSELFPAPRPKGCDLASTADACRP